MKVRSATELQDFLDGSLALRKRELTMLRFQILECRRGHQKDALLRAALPMLYAHWEGFIKTASIAYLSYVSRQSLPLLSLRRNFIALACRSEILVSTASKKASLHQQMIEFLLDNINRAIPLDVDNVIDTESNLSSLVLKEIMNTIGIEYDESWQKRDLLIDHQLLKNRNNIAHGELMRIDLITYEQLHTFVIQSLEEFKTAIENAVALKAYLKT